MTRQITPPQKIGKQMLERGAMCLATDQGDTVYFLGTDAVSATLTCSSDARFRLEISLYGLSKQAETPAHIAKLWSWWIGQRHHTCLGR